MCYFDRYKTELKKFTLWSVWVVTCAAVQGFVDLSHTLVILFFFIIHQMLLMFSHKIVKSFRSPIAVHS